MVHSTQGNGERKHCRQIQIIENPVKCRHCKEHSSLEQHQHNGKFAVHFFDDDENDERNAMMIMGSVDKIYVNNVVCKDLDDVALASGCLF